MAERDSTPDPDGMNESRDDGRSDDRDDSMSADSPPREDRESSSDTPRTPDQFTETPGSHRRGPDGPALDVGG